jgi:diacylglycerol kinase (ATP)
VSTFVLVNPFSRSGRTGRRVPELESLLKKYVGDYQLLATECAGDAERLACVAVERGATRLVVAGGDGTVSEAVSGLLRCGGESVELALLPLGTGRDLARLLRLGADLEASVARLATGRRRRVDAGRVRCRARGGSERERCFLNIASLGLSAESTRWLASRTGRRGPLSYLISAFIGFARYEMPPVTIRVDDRIVYEGRLTLAAACNGQYFAGGMRVGPEASIDDGLLDLIVVEGMSLRRSLLYFSRLIGGRHVDDRRVRVHRGAKVGAESATEVWVEADGEPVGTLPATIEVLPGAVKLCGLP